MALVPTNDTRKRAHNKTLQVHRRVPDPITHVSTGSTYNCKRHVPCGVKPGQPLDLNWKLSTRRRTITEEVLSKSVPYCPSLSKEDKLYVYNKSKVYSTKNLQNIKKKAYSALVYEQQKGKKNSNYFKAPRQIHWGTGTSSFTQQIFNKRKNQHNIRVIDKDGSGGETDGPRNGTNQDSKTDVKETNTSDSGSHYSREGKKTNSSTRSSRSRTRSSSYSSIASTCLSTSDTDQHHRTSDAENLTQRSKDNTNDDPGSHKKANDIKDTNRKSQESRKTNSFTKRYHLREGPGKILRFGRRVGNTKDNSDDDYDSDSSSTTSSSTACTTSSHTSDKQTQQTKLVKGKNKPRNLEVKN